MNSFDKVLRFITEKMAWVSMFAIVVCMLLVVSDIVRYHAVGKPIPGTHELVELIAAVILSMGIGYLTFVRGHVSVGILVDRFRPRVQAVFDLFTGIVSLGFTIWLTYGVIELAKRNIRFGWVTGVLQIPRYPFMILIAVSLGLACIVLFRDVINAVISIAQGGEDGA